MDGKSLGHVDVLCTFFNAEPTLRDTLDALRDQTVTGMSVILVDDGSDDGSARIAGEFVAADSRFSLIVNPSRGRGRALDYGLRHGTAPLVAIMDADDLAHARWLEDAAALTAGDERFAVLGFGRAYIYDSGRAAWPAGTEPAEPPRDVTTRLGRTNPIGHSGSCISRVALEAVGGYDLSRQSHFDYDLWIRLARAGYRLGRSDSKRIAKRYHSGQKFAHRPGYLWSSFQLQGRAIRSISKTPLIDWMHAVIMLTRRIVRYLLDRAANRRST